MKGKDEKQLGIGIIWDFGVKHKMSYHTVLAAVTIEHQLDKLKKEVKKKRESEQF